VSDFAALTPGSHGFVLIIITVTATALTAQVSKRFTNVAAGYGGQLAQVADLDDAADGTLLFNCPAPTTTNVEGNPCISNNNEVLADDAVTSNLGEDEADFNEIALCPSFFGGGSLATDVLNYNANKAKGKINTFGAPRDPGKHTFRDKC